MSDDRYITTFPDPRGAEYGLRKVMVETRKNRTPPPLKGPAVRGQKELALDMFDLLARLKAISDMAHTVERGTRDPEQSASDKNELRRAIGRLEADIRRRGVR